MRIAAKIARAQDKAIERIGILGHRPAIPALFAEFLERRAHAVEIATARKALEQALARGSAAS
jgi:hypothetical protein